LNKVYWSTVLVKADTAVKTVTVIYFDNKHTILNDLQSNVKSE